MDKPSLKALRKLHEKATPGPWRFSGSDVEQLSDGGKGYPLDFYPDCVTIIESDVDFKGDPKGVMPGCEPDVAAMVAAYNALPALLAIAEAAIADRRAQEAVSMACLDDMDSEEAQAAFQQGHDADKALAAALALVEE